MAKDDIATKSFDVLSKACERSVRAHQTADFQIECCGVCGSGFSDFVDITVLDSWQALVSWVTTAPLRCACCNVVTHVSCGFVDMFHAYTIITQNLPWTCQYCSSKSTEQIQNTKHVTMPQDGIDGVSIAASHAPTTGGGDSNAVPQPTGSAATCALCFQPCGTATALSYRTNDGHNVHVACVLFVGQRLHAARWNWRVGLLGPAHIPVNAINQPASSDSTQFKAANMMPHDGFASTQPDEIFTVCEGALSEALQSESLQGRRCEVCSQPAGGLTVPCHSRHCTKRMHVSCALQARLLVEHPSVQLSSSSSQLATGYIDDVAEDVARLEDIFIYCDEHEPEVRYCFCGQPHADGRFMVRCDRCHDWFHGECVGFDEDADTDVEFACARCGTCHNKHNNSMQVGAK